jgi:hypothetical protein
VTSLAWCGKPLLAAAAAAGAGGGGGGEGSSPADDVVRRSHGVLAAGYADGTVMQLVVSAADTADTAYLSPEPPPGPAAAGHTTTQ